MEATAGSRPSSTWRSILKARALVSKGLRIRIGNGYYTNIWSSPWIPDDGRFTLYTPRPPTIFYPWKVADLIDEEAGTWNMPFIEATFWPVDCERIGRIPLGAITSDDRLVWHFSKNGIYSVKSAYQLSFAMKEGEGSLHMGSSSGAQQERWAELWNLCLPPKIKLFLWRACKNILPHAAELTRRHVISNPMCIHCKEKMETLAHVLMECRGVREIWASEPFSLPQTNSHEPMWSLIHLLKRSVSQELFLVGLVTWWKIWDVRNKELYGTVDGFPADLVGWSTEYLARYHSAQVKPPPSQATPLPDVWVPPDPGVIKINVDAAFPDSSTYFRVSMVARNSQGVCLWWACKEFPGRPTPSEGEAMAVLFGLQVAVQQQWERLTLETDCLPVFRYLRLQTTDLVSFGAVLEACFRLRSSFISLNFNFVRRSGNSLAHSLATSRFLSCTEGPFIPSFLME